MTVLQLDCTALGTTNRSPQVDRAKVITPLTNAVPITTTHRPMHRIHPLCTRTLDGAEVQAVSPIARCLGHREGRSSARCLLSRAPDPTQIAKSRITSRSVLIRVPP